MDDMFLVCRSESIGYLHSKLEKRFHHQRFTANPILQGVAFEQLHGDKRPVVRVINFVDGADVGMIKSRGGLGFALETAEGLGILANVVGQEFQCYKASE